MSMNTLLLRLEGPMQAWGNQESKFVIRRTAEAPTKSGIAGLLCAALGVRRAEAPEWLPRLCALSMGVRIDRPGVRWWDYHTIGAKMAMRIAKGERKTNPGAVLTRREYLCDASFLVALAGEADLIERLAKALRSPVWTPYLGRKSCAPTRPILEHHPCAATTVIDALTPVPWRRRYSDDEPPKTISLLIDWQPTPAHPEAPVDALICYDVPMTFDPPSHGPRYVIRTECAVGPGGTIRVADDPSQSRTPRPARPRADYKDTRYRAMRNARLNRDMHLCVVCKSPANTVQHITYRHAGGNENLEELRTLCRLCHDAVTTIEYGLGMGIDRINPEDRGMRDAIVAKRDEIIAFRSMETRRRHLSVEDGA